MKKIVLSMLAFLTICVLLVSCNDNSGDTGLSTDTSAGVSINVDGTNNTDTKVEGEGSILPYEKYGNKVYFAFEKKDIYYSEIMQYEFVSECFKMPMNEEGGAYFKVISTYEELLTYITPMDFDPDTFKSNYVICVRQYYYDGGNAFRLVGYYGLELKDGKYDISLDYYRTEDQMPHDQYCGPQRYTNYIIVPKDSIEYSDQVQQITVNGENHIGEKSTDTGDEDVPPNDEEPYDKDQSHYFFMHDEKATLPKNPTSWVIEKGSELEESYGLQYSFASGTEQNYRVVLYLPNEPERDFLITEKEIKNGNLYLTVEKYSLFTNSYLERNNVKFYDLYIEDSSELSDNYDVYVLVKIAGGERPPNEIEQEGLIGSWMQP